MRKLYCLFFHSLMILIAISQGIIHYSQSASSDSANAKAKIQVLASISITSTRNIDFGDVTPGDWSGYVSPWDPVRSASFNVSGQPGKTIAVTLPSDTDVKMIVDGGNPGNVNDTIRVTAFNMAGNLSLTNGSTTITVGATHQAISMSQTIGVYEGSFTVQVVYNN